MNIYILRIGNEVVNVYRNVESLKEELKSMVNDDFDWEVFNNDLMIDYDFGTGYEEEVKCMSFLLK